MCVTSILPHSKQPAHQTNNFAMQFHASTVVALFALLGSTAAMPADCARQTAKVSWGHCFPGQVYRFDQIVKDLGTCTKAPTLLSSIHLTDITTASQAIPKANSPPSTAATNAMPECQTGVAIILWQVLSAFLTKVVY